MGVTSKIAGAFAMTDDAWKRHANPWSVWTRFAAIPLMILIVLAMLMPIFQLNELVR